MFPHRRFNVLFIWGPSWSALLAPEQGNDWSSELVLSRCKLHAHTQLVGQRRASALRLHQTHHDYTKPTMVLDKSNLRRLYSHAPYAIGKKKKYIYIYTHVVGISGVALMPWDCLLTRHSTCQCPWNIWARSLTKGPSQVLGTVSPCHFVTGIYFFATGLYFRKLGQFFMTF